MRSAGDTFQLGNALILADIAIMLLLDAEARPADAQDRRLSDVAHDIVTRRLRLDPDPPGMMV